MELDKTTHTRDIDKTTQHTQGTLTKQHTTTLQETRDVEKT